MNGNLFHRTNRICPNCGMSVPEDNLFCEACGTRYEAPAATVSNNQRRCPNGHPVENDEYSFCIICGVKLIEQEEIVIPEPVPSGWTCSCGGKNDADNAFCITCGKPKSSAAPEAAPASGWTCSCGNINDDDCAFCISCGSPKGSAAPAAEPETAPEAAPASGWTCSCGNVNDDDCAFCINCGSPKGGSAPVAAPEAAPAAPVSGWTCSCGAVNDDDCAFCITCGTPKGGRKPEPVGAPSDSVVIPKAASKPMSSLPDIPDIMRPLSNKDMKREGDKVDG